MKFTFKIQQYQTEAVEAVVNVFRGQGLHNNTVYKRDLGSIEDTREETQLSLFTPLSLTATSLLQSRLRISTTSCLYPNCNILQQ